MYDGEQQKLVNREIEFIPALFKIYDEILVNAADNKVRDPSQSLIKVNIDKENNEISIMNNGKGKIILFTNKPRRPSCLTFGDSQLAMRIHENTALWLAVVDSKAKIAPRAISRYIGYALL